VALFSLHCLGCSINANLKDSSLSRAEKQTSEKRLQYGGGVGVLITRLLVFTLSESDSYLTGYTELDKSIEFEKRTNFSLSNSQLGVSIWAQPENCHSDERTTAQLAEVLGSVFGLESEHIPAGSVDVYFVPDGIAVTNRFFALRPGRELSLKFFFPCANANPQRDIFAGILHTAHEITHAVLFLRGQEKLARDETLADGAPACIYEDIKKRGYVDLLEALSEEQFFNSNPLTYDPNHPPKADDLVGLCERWHRAVLSEHIG
jgi:hypothetical protein